MGEHPSSDIRSRMPRATWDPTPKDTGCTGVPTHLRELLAGCQYRDIKVRPLIDQLRHSLDPEKQRRRNTGEPHLKGGLIPWQGSAKRLGEWRLAPLDGVLEIRVDIAGIGVWVAYLPDGPLPTQAYDAFLPIPPDATDDQKAQFQTTVRRPSSEDG